jgi:hypothetical protein
VRRPAAQTGPGLGVALALALGAIVWGLYANSLGAGFTSDNHHVLLEDARVRGTTWRHLGLVFGQDYWWPGSVKGLYWPLTTLTYTFNCSVLGNADRPAGYHVVNVLLHRADAVLVYPSRSGSSAAGGSRSRPRSSSRPTRSRPRP